MSKIRELELPRRKTSPIASTSATQAVSAVGKGLSDSPLVLDYAGKSVEIRTLADVVTPLTFSARKLFDFLLLKLTQLNSNSRSVWTNNRVRFFLGDYISLMGYADTRDMRRVCYHQIVEDTSLLGDLQLRQESTLWFGLVQSISLVSHKGDLVEPSDVMDGTALIEVAFQEGLMSHLSECRYVVPFVTDLFYEVQQNENAYAAMKRMVLHYYMPGNLLRGNRDRLKVRTILNCFPACASVEGKYVRRSFRRAMDCLTRVRTHGDPLLRWWYLIDGKKVDPDSLTAIRCRQTKWEGLTVQFEFINIPDYPELKNLRDVAKELEGLTPEEREAVRACCDEEQSEARKRKPQFDSPFGRDSTQYLEDED